MSNTPADQTLPKPAYRVSGQTTTEQPNIFRKLSKLFKPHHSQEEECCTVSRYALRLIDRITGDAYTADELTAELQQATYDGEPVNHVAAIAAAGTANGVTWTNKTAGVAGNSKVLNILDPGASAHTPLSFAIDGDNINVTPVTDAGATATATSGSGGNAVTWAWPVAGTVGNGKTINFYDPQVDSYAGRCEVVGSVYNVYLPSTAGAAGVCAFDVGAGGTGHKITSTLTTPGSAGNARRINVALPTNTNPFGATLLKPSQAAATGTFSAPNYNLLLATGPGTVGVLTVTEATNGSFKVETTAAYAGTWGNGHVTCILDNPNLPSQTLNTVVTNAGGNIAIVVYLPTNTSALLTAATDTDVVASINAALTAASLSTYLLATKLSTAKTFTINTLVQTMALGVNAVALTTAANQATAIAALIHTLDDTPTSVAGSGTDLVAVGGPYSFTGGGAGYAAYQAASAIVGMANFPFVVSANGTRVPAFGDQAADGSTGGVGYAATSTAAQIAALTGFPLAATGTTSNVPAIGNAIVTFTSGADAIPGTPAHLGREAIYLATPGDASTASVWKAMKEDPTTTQDGWIKTLTYYAFL